MLQEKAGIAYEGEITLLKIILVIAIAFVIKFLALHEMKKKQFPYDHRDERWLGQYCLRVASFTIAGTAVAAQILRFWEDLKIVGQHRSFEFMMDRLGEGRWGFALFGAVVGLVAAFAGM